MTVARGEGSPERLGGALRRLHYKATRRAHSAAARHHNSNSTPPKSFGLPPLKVKPEHVSNIKPQEGPFGVPSPLVAGLAATKSKLGMSHPIEISERNYHLNQEKMNMAMLRNIQGLHAPLKLTMEMKFTSKIGHLPFLQRSNFQHDVLTAKHLDIGFEDILNTPELCEVAGQPHAVVERSLGIL